jgi:DNA-binding transcriptional LysR family regulator
LKTRPAQKQSLVVGVGTQVSKQVSRSLIETVHRHKPDVRIEMLVGPEDQLLNQLRTYSVDVVLLDRGVRAQKEQFVSIKIGELEVDFMATPDLARQVKVFPKDLSKIPLLMPTSANTISQSVDRFLARHRITGHIVAMIEDDGVLRLSAVRGLGAAPLLRVSADDDLQQGRLVRLGRQPTGIVKTDWLIVNKRRRHTALVQYLLRNFRLNR